MTRRKVQLQHIEKIKKNQYNIALTQLKQCLDVYNEAKAKVKLLDDYAKDYQLKPSGEPLSIGALCQRQSFLENLTLTIDEQKKSLHIAQGAFNKAQEFVKHTYKEHRGIEILLEQESYKEMKERQEKENNALEEQMIVRHNRKSKDNL